jgi:DNA-binding SARP family transcriptional activator
VAVNTLHVELFGKLSLQRDGQALSNLSAKALELLCYLLLYRDRAHTRETLSAMLWPDASLALSKKYLRQTLWQLQTVSEHLADREQTEAEALIMLNPGWVRINPSAAWWLDVHTFECEYVLTCDIPGENLTDQQAQSLEEAIALYHGDLLETWYQDWCIYERERLQLTYLAMLEQLMRYCEVRQLYTKGVAYGQAILRYDRARECTHRQLMRLHYLASDRTGALRQYDRCVAALQKEFELKPSRDTQALYDQIRSDRLEDAARPAPLGQQGGSWPTTDPMLDLRKRLDQIEASLFAIRHMVQHELSAIGQVLKEERKTLQETPGQTQ